MACGVNGALGKFATLQASGEQLDAAFLNRWDFLSETLDATGAFVRSDNLRGTRARTTTQTRQGAKTIGGGVQFNPSIKHIEELFFQALGSRANSGSGATGGMTITPAESLPTVALLVDKVAEAYQYHTAKLAQLSLSASGPGLLTMGATYVAGGHADGRTFPSIDLPEGDEYVPLQFADLILGIDGTDYQVNSFNLTIDNVVQAILRNSLTPDCIRENDRIVSLAVNAPSNSALLAAIKEPDLDGLTGVLTLGYEGVTATITLNAMQKSLSHPKLAGKGEQAYDATFEANQTGSSPVVDEIVVVTDSTE